MSREEIIQILGEGATEEQISGLLNKFHEKDNDYRAKVSELTNAQNQLNDITQKLSATETKLNSTQSELDNINKSKMTESELIEAQKKEANEYLANSKRIFAKAKAQEILSTIGITDEDLINSLVTDNIELTEKNANIYVNNIKSISESVEKKTKESFANQDLKPTPSNNLQDNGAMTWEKYQTLSESEQSAFANEHPDEFAKL